MALTDAGAPATWPVLHPAFTVFQPARETFAKLWSPYHPAFGAFHDPAAEMLAAMGSATTMFPRGLSQRELAGELGLPQRWVSEMEAGKPGKLTKRLFAMLDATGVRLYAQLDEPTRSDDA